jgi:WD40 repeat protein
VAIGEEGHITIWRVPEGGLVSEPRFERESAAPSLAFSPNGQLLAAGLMRGVAQGGGEDVSVDFTYTCTLWDWEWGAQLHQLPDFGKELAFSPDGSRLVITNYDGVQIWAIQQGTTRNETNRLCGNGDDVLDYDNQGRSSDHPNYGDDW